MTLPKSLVAAALLSALYVGFVIVDHLRFWWNANPDLSGIVFEPAYKDTDVHCEKGAVVVHIDDDTAHWRCPLFVVFGGFSASRPIVPCRTRKGRASH